MRIVTLNTWKNEGDYPARLARIAAGLAALAPDIVCLQECFAGGGCDTALSLSAALGLELHAAPARAKLRSLAGRPTASTSGLAILSRRPGRPSALALPADVADGERIAQRLCVDTPNGPLVLLNLHLTHLGGAPGSALRTRQLTMALAWTREGGDGAHVVCGDLNCRRADPEFTPLRPAAGDELGSTLHGGEGGAIDHALLLKPAGFRVARRFRALDAADARGRYPSDHAAVVLDLAEP